MPKSNEIRVDMKHSNIHPTLFHETEELVSVKDGQVVTTSLRVAEYFGKLHKDVLKSINSLESSELFRARNFAPSCYTRKNGNVSKSYPMYYITRDGFTFLAMGFTGKVAAKFKEAYINAFNEMEEMLRRQETTRYAEKLFHKEVAAFARKMKKLKGNPDYMPFDCLYPGITYMKGESFEDNLRNVFAQVNNAYLSGMNASAHYFKARRELEELKREIAAIARKAHVAY